MTGRKPSGGIIKRPTLGLIGEAGPEAVIPLSKETDIPASCCKRPKRQGK
jgi:hypothetical protein